MSRSEFHTIVTCERCNHSEEIELPERCLRFGQSFIDDVLSDMDWVVDSAKGIDICPACPPPEAG